MMRERNESERGKRNWRKLELDANLCNRRPSACSKRYRVPLFALSSSDCTSSQQTCIASRCDWSMLSFYNKCETEGVRLVRQWKMVCVVWRVLTSLTSENALRKSLLPCVILASTSFLNPPPRASADLIRGSDSGSACSSLPRVSSAALVRGSCRFEVRSR